MRDPGQDGAGGPEAKQARLTSSPQSVPQLFLMAQKGMSEPGGSAECRQSGPQFSGQGPKHFALFKYLLWAYCVTGIRKKSRKKDRPTHHPPGDLVRL